MATIDRVKHDIYPFISYKENLRNAATGKTVIVTGAGTGAGQAIAAHFAAGGASRVIVTGRTSKTLEETVKEIEGAHPLTNVIPVVADVTSESSVAALFGKIKELGVVPDVLVNNAGVVRSQTLIADTDPMTWWGDIEVSAFGSYLCAREYLRMLDGKPGVILNVSSSVSDRVDLNVSAYSISKMTVNRLTEHIQREYGKQGVRCIAFHPGGIASTGMGRMAPPQYAKLLEDTVELPGGTALYLSTERAAYLAGRFVYANWDMEKVEALKDEIVKEDLLISRIKYGEKLNGNFLPPAGMEEFVRNR